MVKNIFVTIIGLLVLNNSVCSKYLFFPVEERWLLGVLDSYRERWTKKRFRCSVTLSPKEKFVIHIQVPRSLYEWNRNWRDDAKNYAEFIYPRVVKLIRTYGSTELLSVFEPKIDLKWRFYLGKTVYGHGSYGRFKWRKGIY